MPKILVPSCSWILSSLQKRGFANQIVSRIRNAATHNEEKSTNPKCHPKESSCGTMSKCGALRFPECVEPHVRLRLDLKCCCNQNLTRNVCEDAPRKPKPKYKEPFKSMWEVCGAKKNCPLKTERSDDNHYEPSDKSERNYTQTWKNCKPLLVKRKICCLNEMCMLPPINKRGKEERPKTAKEKDSELLKIGYTLLKNCMEKPEPPKIKKKKCKKIVMPGCRSAASLVLCVRYRKPSNCFKDCCPYPSYSECKHDDLTQKRDAECHCLRKINVCEANRFLVRKKIFKIEPPLPEWPPRDGQ